MKALSSIIVIFLSSILLVLFSCQEHYEKEMVSSYFEAQYATYPVVTDTTGGILTVEIPSEGTGNILGKSIWYSDSKVKTNTAPPWVQTGIMYFKDYKGDMILGSFEGTSWPLSTNPFAGEGTYKIRNGTGAYEGASGGGTYHYLVSKEMVGDLKFNGILTLPVK